MSELLTTVTLHYYHCSKCNQAKPFFDNADFKSTRLSKLIIAAMLPSAVIPGTDDKDVPCLSSQLVLGERTRFESDAHPEGERRQLANLGSCHKITYCVEWDSKHCSLTRVQLCVRVPKQCSIHALVKNTDLREYSKNVNITVVLLMVVWVSL